MTQKGTISERSREALRQGRRLARYPQWEHRGRGRKAARRFHKAQAHAALFRLYIEAVGWTPPLEPVHYRRWLHSAERHALALRRHR